MEKQMYERIYKYFDNSYLKHDLQFGNWNFVLFRRYAIVFVH